MILNGVRIVDSNKVSSIIISDGKIAQIIDEANNSVGATQLTFQDVIAFPGLINSHDHLDFNLFTQLGDKIYNNYTEWGKHIHTAYADQIAGVLKIPVKLRERWGIYKNLLCGVTTVVNHGEPTGIDKELINVYEEEQSLHSVKFEQNWKRKLNDPRKIGRAAVIHIAEGTDDAARYEADTLVNWNLLRRPLIGIHGVAMVPRQAKNFKALIWCPHSNYFLLNKTAAIDQLKKRTRILFGTDSTLTAGWDIWEHIRLARQTGMLTDAELYQSLTSRAADTWQLNNGRIGTGFDADLVIANATGVDGLRSFFEVQPEDILLILHQGNIRLFDASVLPQLSGIDLSGFSTVLVGNNVKYVLGCLSSLMDDIKHFKPDATFPVCSTATPAA